MSGVKRVAAMLRHRVARPSAPSDDSGCSPAEADSGFSLVEVIVAIGLIGTLMASLSTFYVSSIATTNAQSARQGAIQAALDAMEQVRAVDTTDLLIGRTNTATNAQWAAAPASVTPYLSGMLRAWSAGSGAAKLPTTAVTVNLSGVDYQQHWYVGTCNQPTAADAPCGTANPAGSVQMFRVVIAVTWTDTTCPASGCAYVVSTLVSPANDDPIFNANSIPAPTLDQPANQTSPRDTAIAPFRVEGSGGAPTLTWIAANLPPGLSINSGTGQITGTPITAGVYPNVTVTLRDSLARDATVNFTWTVTVAPPALGAIADQKSTVGESTVLQPTVSGGATPLAWSATGLPPGLSINSGTGRISGTFASAVARDITVTVRDTQNRTDTVTFLWTVTAPPTLTNPGQQVSYTSDQDSDINLQIRLTGGTGPFTWQATGLPNGLSLDSTGRVIGLVTSGPTGLTRPFTCRVTVTDKDNRTSTVTFNWYVLPGGGGR